MLDIAILGQGPAATAALHYARYRGAHAARFDVGAPDSLVWGVGGGPPEPFRVDALGQPPRFVRALVLCPAAQERAVPCPGWTLPGVSGLLDAAPRRGRRSVVAGAGARLDAVAAQVSAAGGIVQAVIDLGATSRQRGWHRHRIVRVLGPDTVRAVEVAPLSGGRVRRIACDMLHLGYGEVPDTQVTRLFGAAHRYVPRRGGWAAVVDAGLRTTVPMLYAAETPAAARRAVGSALGDLGLPSPPTPAGYAKAPTALPALDSLVRAIPPRCVVCPCEGVTRAALDAALRSGVRGLPQVKQATRCGMGLCQGRLCAEAMAGLAGLQGGRDAAGQDTARLPLRPVPLDALMGAFSYADIPVPPPAPP